MRILFIDTSDADVSIAVISGQKVLASITETIPNAHSIYTVSFLDKVIKDAKLVPSDIEKILVSEFYTKIILSGKFWQIITFL